MYFALFSWMLSPPHKIYNEPIEMNITELTWNGDPWFYICLLMAQRAVTKDQAGYSTSVMDLGLLSRPTEEGSWTLGP